MEYQRVPCCGICHIDRGRRVELVLYSFTRDKLTAREFGVPSGPVAAHHCPFCGVERHSGKHLERESFVDGRWITHRMPAVVYLGSGGAEVAA